VKRFRAKGYEPEGYTLYSYGAVQAWAEAVRRAKSIDTAKVILQLKKGSFETVPGRLGFDRKGDVTATSYVMYEWKNGKYDYFK
jgi:branched-chain amino acid transport system substrate-binding protein